MNIRLEFEALTVVGSGKSMNTTSSYAKLSGQAGHQAFNKITESPKSASPCKVQRLEERCTEQEILNPIFYFGACLHF